MSKETKKITKRALTPAEVARVSGGRIIKFI